MKYLFLVVRLALGVVVFAGVSGRAQEPADEIKLLRHKSYSYVEPLINTGTINSYTWILNLSTLGGRSLNPQSLALRSDPTYQSAFYNDERMPQLFPMEVMAATLVTISMEPSLLLHAPGSATAPMKQKLKLVSRCPDGPDCVLADLYLGSRVDYFPEGYEHLPTAPIGTVVVSDIQPEVTVTWRVDPYLSDPRDDELIPGISTWVFDDPTRKGVLMESGQTPGRIHFSFLPMGEAIKPKGRSGLRALSNYVYPEVRGRGLKDAALRVIYVDYGMVKPGDAPQKPFKVYRGYAPHHRGFGDAAVRGVATPGDMVNGHRDAVLHTVESGNSVFVSTSINPQEARRVAGDGGIVLEFDVTAGQAKVHATVPPRVLGSAPPSVIDGGDIFPAPPDEDEHVDMQVLLEGEWRAITVHRYPYSKLPKTW